MRQTENVTIAPGRQQGPRIDDFVITPEFETGQRVFRVKGEGVERFAQMTNFDYYESAKRFQKVLEVAGILKKLRKAGVVEGDTVLIGTSGGWT